MDLPVPAEPVKKTFWRQATAAEEATTAAAVSCSARHERCVGGEMRTKDSLLF